MFNKDFTIDNQQYTKNILKIFFCIEIKCKFVQYLKLNIMTKQEIEQEMKNLYSAMKAKLLSVNDYSTMYHNLAQKLKKIENGLL